MYLHYWYLDKKMLGGEVFNIAHGNVSGHPHLTDTMDIHTSKIENIDVDYEKGELIIKTMNSVYHCPLEYCNFNKQDKQPEIIPNYLEIKQKYKDKIVKPIPNKNSLLLVLSDFDDYYFNSLIADESNNKEKLQYSDYPHISMFQDSYIIRNYDRNIDIRYLPHQGNLEFYELETDGMPLYAENIGRSVIYLSLSKSLQIKLLPGERKEVSDSSAEKEPVSLPNGDLYPATELYIEKEEILIGIIE